MRWFTDARILLAIFFGALIGATVPEAYISVMWLKLPLGAALGGIIAYVLFDPMRFSYANWRAAKETFLVVCRYIEWMLWTAIIAFTISFCLALLYISLTFVFGDFNLSSSINYFKASAIVTLFFGWMISSIIFGEATFDKSACIKENERRKVLRHFTLRYGNPVVLILKLVRVTPALLLLTILSIIWLLIRIPNGLAKIKLFACRVIRYYHTHAASVCLVDGAIGAVLGILLGNPLAGGIVGAILGVINYEIVSVRILKVAPSLIKQKS